MEPEVIFDESGDEEIAVVVAVLHPQIERDIMPIARLLAPVGLELSIQERVLRPLVDQERRAIPPALFKERCRIVLVPCRTIRAEVARQRFFAPWASHRRTDRSEGQIGRATSELQSLAYL